MPSLALKYRPRRWSDMTGQRHVRVVLQAMVGQQDMRPAFIFAGAYGTGKTSSARILASALNCEMEEPIDRPCTKCPSCLAIADCVGTDVQELDAASNGLVDNIRSIRESARYVAQSRWKVYIIDEASQLSSTAANALLKTLEEPPPNVVFVLCTTEPSKVLPTILSRCMMFDFRRLSETDMVKRLSYIAAREEFDVEPSLVQACAQRANGSMRNAVMLLDQATTVHARTGGQLADLVGIPATGLPVITALAGGDVGTAWGHCDQALARHGDISVVVTQIVDVMKQMLVSLSVDSEELLDSEQKDVAKLAQKVGLNKLLKAMQEVWTYAGKLQGSNAVNSRSLLDLLCAQLLQCLCTVEASSNGHSSVEVVSSAGVSEILSQLQV